MTTRWKQKFMQTFCIAIAILVVILILSLILHFCGVYTTSTTPTNDRNNINKHKFNFNSINSSDSYNNYNKFNNNNYNSISNSNSTIVSEKSLPAHSSENTTSPYDYGQHHQYHNNTNRTHTHHQGVDKAAATTTTTTTTTATTSKSEEYHREEYVRPAKLHHIPLHNDDLLYESKRNGSDKVDFMQRHRITGNYRNSSSRIWDPHPEYKIDAFGHHLHLVLYQDATFMPDTLKVTHVYLNRTEHFEKDEHQRAKIQGCFYKGSVRGDDESVVAVSLCNGMRGHIRTSFGSFFIEPIEEYTKEDSNILHMIRRESKQHKIHSSHPHDPSCPIDEHLRDHSIDDENAIDDIGWTSRYRQMPPRSSTSTKNHERRKKRHIDDDRQYTLEVLIAVDRKMDNFHGDQTEEYVLTLMQIVSNIYSDASIGNSINVTLINMMILKDDLSIEYIEKGVYASHLLKRFCSFIRTKKVHYDTAILLTREQICRNTPETKCDTLGLAELGTVCKQQSCSIVQDNGLPAAFTIAHELGHVLNMPHDDDIKCSNFHKEGRRKLHIMSSTMGEEIHPWSWSDCSRHYVTEFLEKDDISCLQDKPNDIMKSKNKQLPGEAYDLDQQCELIHGANAKYCNISSEDEKECGRLWCFDRADSHDCRSSNLPWADGTPCRDGYHWCQKGSCVRRDRSVLRPIDGGWGPFSEYSDCSRMCGGGIQESTRECNNPVPENGGKYCPGDRKKWRSCNTHDCPEGTPDFREEQCTNLSGNNFGIIGVGHDVRWVPKYGVSPKDECKLFCRVENSAAYFQLSEKVKDGTTCSYDSFNKCVNGICRPAGCDNELNSAAKLDKCGVCQGNNATCIEIVKNIYRSNISQLQSSGTAWYFQVAKIPKGAANIEITQPDFTMDNYIVLLNDKKEYLLNGNKLINTFAKRFAYAGVTFDYSGSNSTLEKVNTTYSRKIERDLYIEILSLPRQSGKDNGILLQYKYTEEIEPVYEWDWSDFSPCNSECNGQKQKVPICIRRGTNMEYPEDKCDERAKPSVRKVTMCNEDCEFNLITRKHECNCTRGGIRNISYQCVKLWVKTNQTQMVDRSYCADNEPKAAQESCTNECGEWQYTDWSECIGICDHAKRERKAYCILNGIRVSDAKCLGKKGSLQTPCLNDCYSYSRGEETPCSVTCGIGVRTTAIYCKHNNQIVDKHFCAGLPMPSPNKINCTMPPCPEQKARDPKPYQIHYGNRKYIEDFSNNIPYHQPHMHVEYKWEHTNWGECNVATCKKNRTVYCPDSIQRCPLSKKPIDIVHCCKPKYKISWTPCNTECGAGKRYRKLDCWLFSENKKFVRKIDFPRCKNARLPKKQNAEKYCDAGRCLWNGSWTQCSATCSKKISTRRLYCQNEKTKQKVDEKYCRNMKRPPTKRRCFKQKIVKTCACDGYEYQHTIHYIPRTKNRPLLRCPKLTKEVKGGRCMPPSSRCARSCSDMRRYTRKDGEYTFMIGARNISIYCHDMVRHPKEFITLPYYQENYSHYYSKLAEDPRKCPTPGDSNESPKERGESKRTIFTRIRIELDRLRVDTNDFTFAMTDMGRESMSYGSAGDCYNLNGECPRGEFSINLEGTGFRIRPTTQWTMSGNYEIIKYIWKLQPPYLKVAANCGGYCANCSIKNELLLETV